MPGGPAPHAAAISRCQSLESCPPSLSGAALQRVAAFVKRLVSDSSGRRPFIDEPAVAIAPETLPLPFSDTGHADAAALIEASATEQTEKKIQNMPRGHPAPVVNTLKQIRMME